MPEIEDTGTDTVLPLEIDAVPVEMIFLDESSTSTTTIEEENEFQPLMFTLMDEDVGQF